MWLLGIELRASGRPASALNLSLSPLELSLQPLLEKKFLWMAWWHSKDSQEVELGSILVGLGRGRNHYCTCLSQLSAFLALVV